MSTGPYFNQVAQRKSRQHQAKHRGSARSYKTELENLQLLLCWEVDQLSEGQVVALLDIDRVTIRKMRLEAIDAGMRLADALYRFAATSPEADGQMKKD